LCSLPAAMVDPELAGKEIIQCTMTPSQAMARCQ
jgi:hypothetical protein